MVAIRGRLFIPAIHNTHPETAYIALPEITVLSKDQFSFRLALSPVMTVVDARRFSESQPIAEPHPLGHFLATIGTHPALHPSLAAATLEVAGARTLTETMAASGEVLAAIQAKVADAVPGATIESVLLTGINLPPETRKMFTDVERSKMEALSALERARGEQAALRVLANAARLVTDNPALANPRLLQAIESSRGSTTIILGEGAVSPTGTPQAGRLSTGERIADEACSCEPRRINQNNRLPDRGDDLMGSAKG